MKALRLLAVAVCLVATAASAELHVWVDGEGRTHVTDDPAKIPPALRDGATSSAREIRGLWDEGLTGPPLETPGGPSGGEEGRVQRILRGALDDLGRGETARAQTALQHVLELEPARPEAHWYLALLDWQRGRLTSSEAHLRAFLEAAGDRFQPWRVAAEERLQRLEAERRLLAPSGQLRLVTLESPHFRVQLDEALQQAGAPDFSERVLHYLGEARDDVGSRLGVFPSEPTGVVLYGKASYLRAHRHRFSFQTVGFYDGRIHVVSAAHPAGELRSLLFHEYTHALFRESAGSDRPFWLNEGLAELSERTSQGRPPLARSERARLRRAIDDGSWLSLRRLAPSFSGLDQDGAKLAYLEATAAAAWLETRTDVEARRALVRALGQGRSADAALLRTVGLDTDGVDEALRRTITAAFAAAALAPDED